MITQDIRDRLNALRETSAARDAARENMTRLSAEYYAAQMAVEKTEEASAAAYRAFYDNAATDIAALLALEANA